MLSGWNFHGVDLGSQPEFTRDWQTDVCADGMLLISPLELPAGHISFPGTHVIHTGTQNPTPVAGRHSGSPRFCSEKIKFIIL
jgi:hypothetical protein